MTTNPNVDHSEIVQKNCLNLTFYHINNYVIWNSPKIGTQLKFAIIFLIKSSFKYGTNLAIRCTEFVEIVSQAEDSCSKVLEQIKEIVSAPSLPHTVGVQDQTESIP